MPPPLYYHPNWSDMSHQKPELYLLSLFMLQFTPHVIVLLSSPTSMFLPTITICPLVIVGFFYPVQLSLMLLVTSRVTLLSFQWMIQLPSQLDVLPVLVFYRLGHILYLYIPFERCSLSRQFLISQTKFLLLVTVILSVECVQLFYASPYVR